MRNLLPVCGAWGHRKGRESDKLDATRKEDWEYIIEECPSGAIRWDSIVMTVSQAAEAVMKDAPFYRYGGGVTLSGGEPLSNRIF